MPCTRETPCGGMLVEDRAENLAMAREGLPQRFYSCLAGHPYIVNPPEPLPPSKQNPEKACETCGRLFRPAGHGSKALAVRFCSFSCAAQKTTRGRKGRRKAAASEVVIAPRQYWVVPA